MDYLFYFLTLFSSRLMDRIVVLSPPQKVEPIKGDGARLFLGGERVEAIVEEIFYEEDNLTRKIVLRALR